MTAADAPMLLRRQIGISDSDPDPNVPELTSDESSRIRTPRPDSARSQATSLKVDFDWPWKCHRGRFCEWLPRPSNYTL